MNEIWKDVVGYEGVCLVSNMGNVKRKGKNANLKQRTNRDGYMLLVLCVGCHNTTDTVYTDFYKYNFANLPFSPVVVLWSFFSLVIIIIFNYLCHNTKNGCSVVRCCEVL